jgi:hypothetical protein
MNHEQFCGHDAGPRTIFSIDVTLGYDIRELSFFGATEAEVLLPPLSHFRVKGASAPTCVLDDPQTRWPWVPMTTTQFRELPQAEKLRRTQQGGFPDTVQLTQLPPADQLELQISAARAEVESLRAELAAERQAREELELELDDVKVALEAQEGEGRSEVRAELESERERRQALEKELAKARRIRLFVGGCYTRTVEFVAACRRLGKRYSAALGRVRVGPHAPRGTRRDRRAPRHGASSSRFQSATVGDPDQEEEERTAPSRAAYMLAAMPALDPEAAASAAAARASQRRTVEEARWAAMEAAARRMSGHLA